MSDTSQGIVKDAAYANKASQQRKVSPQLRNELSDTNGSFSAEYSSAVSGGLEQRGVSALTLLKLHRDERRRRDGFLDYFSIFMKNFSFNGLSRRAQHVISPLEIVGSSSNYW